MAPPALSTRDLADASDRAEALAQAAGVHGVYVQNALADGDGSGFVYGPREQETGLCWFGPRGNLVVIAIGDEAPGAVADAIQCRRLPWRLAMGPAAIVDAVRARCTGSPLVHRTQVYYLADGGGEGPAAAAAVGARLARPDDRERLVQAALQLNHSDLAIDPRRVDRRWLYETIEARIANGTTRVIGPPGRIDCKLDLGSRGPGGSVIEGVFTFAKARGSGLATALVRATLAELDGVACLHVGEHNVPARAAYERAGMREVGRCRILLLG